MTDNTERPEKIIVHGAKVHNLKNIDVEVPLNRIVGIAGVSGSGAGSSPPDEQLPASRSGINARYHDLRRTMCGKMGRFISWENVFVCMNFRTKVRIR